MTPYAFQAWEGFRLSAAVVEQPEGRVDRRTVLVVEDEILVRLLITEELRLAGFTVVEAANADEALTILQSAAPIDLVMTDVRMPGSMDGLGLAEVVRSIRPELKIIVASGHLPTLPASNTVDAFFGKPYDPARVVQRVKELLADEEK